ncbi:hypothetical protein [Xylella fastidiosa]|uniref:Uncharacterized protein n=1 Tax=Xylella fastidiosa subsp. multiplex TaxID=644357 RepID=A0AAW6HXP6_XYLFS|nr:hypothetical protein [Xylella fastidiosa]MDC6409330.1 hypothetical protein [Xylella fastidiosa subsp. multiplex]MDD0894221.1 hypothetical protein [Xylella fastidiosa subsp. multiplex]
MIFGATQTNADRRRDSGTRQAVCTGWARSRLPPDPQVRHNAHLPKPHVKVVSSIPITGTML